jgi:hypothetical protein
MFYIEDKINIYIYIFIFCFCFFKRKILSEISALIIKLIKSSSELSNRVCFAKYLWILIDEGVCSKEVIRVEFIKYVIKFCGSDRSD